MKNISEKIYQILDTPKNFWEKILRLIIGGIVASIAVVYIHIVMWMAWIFFGN